MQVNCCKAPEEGAHATPREGEAQDGEQERRRQPVKHDVVKAAVVRGIGPSKKAASRFAERSEPVEVGSRTDPRDHGPVSLVESRGFGE